MGILDRFTGIMKSNINALLDKAEDPAKIVDQTLRDLREDLAEVKKETANVMAEAKRSERELDECESEINRMQQTAVKALQAGNEGDARVLLERKATLEQKKASLTTANTVAQANATKMRQMHDKLVKDITEMEAKKDAIKATVSVAKAQERMNKMTGSIKSTSSLEAMDRMEAKANKMLDAANAMADLNVDADTENADAIADKYATGSSAVDDELARMKAELGL